MEACAMKVAEFRLTRQSDKKRSHHEMDLQKTVVDWLTLVLPKDAKWIGIPNGAHMSARECAKLKHHGMLTPGAPDLMVFWNKRAIGIELKAGNNKETESQVQCAEQLAQAGTGVHVCRSVDDVRYTLYSYDIPLREVRTWIGL